MKANEYLVLSECVEEGIAYGWMRAHKHVENPSEESIKEFHVDTQPLYV